MNAQNQQIQLLITMRLKRLHREGYPGIRYLDLENIFFNYIWKKGVPAHLSIISDTILNISTDKIIQYLSLDASISADKTKLRDYLDEV